MSKRPKLEDIAKLCGVSTATVSRILNKHPDFSASAEVRKRVLETTEKIGYAPDLAARNLNRKQTNLIGVFASPYTHFSAGINEPLLDGIAEVVHENNYDAFIEISRRTPTANVLPFWRFDGAILLQAPPPEITAALGARRVPYVSLNEIIGKPVSTVLADDIMGTELALAHFAELGHRRLAYANANKSAFEHYSVTDRHETLLRWAGQNAMQVVDGHDQRFDSADNFLANAVMKQNATAVLAYDHQIGIQLVSAAARLGLRVPEDFSLICFNDVFPVAELYPSLTVVAVSGIAMGKMAGNLLMQSITGTAKDLPSQIKLPEKLIVRASTGPMKSRQG
jgi:LacI family transcriptional regulator